MARIRIFIARHLCTAPRAQKEAAALAAAGHEVTIHGVWFDPTLASRDERLMQGQRWQFMPVRDCRPVDLRRRLRWFHARIRRRMAVASYQRSGKISADLFGYGHSTLADVARNAPADLAIFHSEGGLWIADQLLRQGRRVGIDFEDWFSQDLPPESRAGRPVAEIQQLERSLLRHSAYTFATSRAMARALAADAHSREPRVIYNTFPASPRTVAPLRDRSDRQHPSLHWFSLVLGPDRGLETFAEALHHIPTGCEIHLRGDGSDQYRSHLRSLVPPEHRANLHFHSTVPNDELDARIGEHDIGLALEVSRIPSRNLTITNKLFQYLQAGLAVIASDTAGHREVLGQHPNAGKVFEAENSRSLATALREMFANRSSLDSMQRAARKAADTTFSHEHQVQRYVAAAEFALEQPVANAIN